MGSRITRLETLQRKQVWEDSSGDLEPYPHRLGKKKSCVQLFQSNSEKCAGGQVETSPRSPQEGREIIWKGKRMIYLQKDSQKGQQETKETNPKQSLRRPREIEYSS